jgi:two-component system, response regulator PdtaR
MRHQEATDRELTMATPSKPARHFRGPGEKPPVRGVARPGGRRQAATGASAPYAQHSARPDGMATQASGTPQPSKKDDKRAFSAQFGSDKTAAAKQARILIVEDDYFVAMEVEHQLQQAGFEVVGIASTAEQALKIGAAERPVLAIMDIRLAGPRDGVDAAIELQSRYEIPSIFATAHGDNETRRRANEARPLGWLTKPFSSSALLATIKAALKARE